MAYESYRDKPKRWGEETAPLVAKAQEVLAEYAAGGYILTLRQLYYQFVARGYISNNLKSYKRLGEIVGDARMNGDIDWNAIEDRGRNLRGVSHWDSPAKIIAASAASYHRDKWIDQPQMVEVWVEKEALLGVFERVCYQLDIPVFACKGYTSLSEMKVAGDRMAERHEERGQDTVVLHFGDHDPSGIDMTRDIQDRLDVFTRHTGVVQVQRLALTMDQVTEWNPPPNPAKVQDSRFENYLRSYGRSCWELDALRPQVLADLVEAQVDKYRDNDLWQEAKEQEETEQKLLAKASKNWPGVVSYLQSPLKFDWPRESL
jgi:hypothetical protein